jgi:putative phosphoribosyl transferase
MVAVTHSPSREVRIAAGGKALEGTLTLPEAASAVVVFAHGSGSSRHSPRNRLVADAIVQAGIGTLLFDLLSTEEEEQRFNIDLLARRLEEATLWLTRRAETHSLRVGYFGASTGAAAALVAAARLREQVDAVVSRGGRPDLAGPYLPKVMAPSLLIVGALDREVITLNEKAYAQLTCTKAVQIVAGASHLFEERGTLERVAELAVEWFRQFLLDDPEHAIRSDEDDT